MDVGSSVGLDAGDPRGAIVAVFGAIKDIGFWFYLASIFAVFMRNRYATGTGGRYVFSSLYRPLSLCGPILWMLNIVLDALDESKPRWYLFLDGMFLALTIYQYYSFRTDDDDFWKGLGGRIKRHLVVRRRRLSPAAAQP